MLRRRGRRARSGDPHHRAPARPLDSAEPGAARRRGLHGRRPAGRAGNDLRLHFALLSKQAALRPDADADLLARPCAARSPAAPAQPGQPCAAQCSAPLRPGQRLLPALAGRRHAVFLRLLGGWDGNPGGGAGSQEASHRRQAGLAPGQRVLDIGSGWGGLRSTLPRRRTSTSPASPWRRSSWRSRGGAPRRWGWRIGSNSGCRTIAR